MLTQLTAVELTKKMKQKELSPVEVIDFYLERIEQLNPAINAFVYIAHKEAKEQAQKAEQALMRGEETGPLYGVPVAIKDLTVTKGMPTTYGSPVFKDDVPNRDATLVQRLKKAGAIIVGKTNTPEFGHKGTTDNLLFGATKNPWNTDKTAGGSSGGSAAAVAARLVPVAEGSDGGGSIRIPASFCGVYGLKPTFGRIPYDSNIQNVFGALEPFLHHGPITYSVRDAALLLKTMQGPAPTDPFSLPETGDDYLAALEKDIQGLKIAYTPDFGMYEVAAEVKEIVAAAVHRLSSLGCTVEEVAIDFDLTLEAFIKFFTSMWFVGAAASLGELLKQKPTLISDTMRRYIEAGTTLSAVEYRKLETTRTRIWLKIQELFTQYDLIVSPTLATTAFDYRLEGPPAINGKPIQPDSDWMLTQIFNVTGLPAASLPVGFSADGLPVGLQIAANRFQDVRVLQLSYAYEKVFHPLRNVPSF